VIAVVEAGGGAVSVAMVANGDRVSTDTAADAANDLKIES
jgi:hypothetical protein